MNTCTGMDENSGRFYSAVFSNVMLNLYAVQKGWFDTLICDTDDPQAGLKWKEALPQVVARLRSGSH